MTQPVCRHVFPSTGRGRVRIPFEPAEPRTAVAIRLPRVAARHQPQAELHRCQRCDIALNRVLDRGAFDLSRALDLGPSFLDPPAAHGPHCAVDCGHDHSHDHSHDHHGNAVSDKAHAVHRHQSDIGSVSLRAGELNFHRFFPWVQKMAEEQGQNILRMKGSAAPTATTDGNRYRAYAGPSPKLRDETQRVEGGMEGEPVPAHAGRRFSTRPAAPSNGAGSNACSRRVRSLSPSWPRSSSRRWARGVPRRCAACRTTRPAPAHSRTSSCAGLPRRAPHRPRCGI
jgi:hypothetical protein